jgi:hypothetical protein
MASVAGRRPACGVPTHPVSSSGIQRRPCGVRPSGVRPCPSGRVRLVPPRPVRRATVTTGTVEVPVGCRAAEPARWSVGVGGEPCRGSGRATAATRDAERPGRPGRRAERPSLWRRCGTGAGCRARWPRLPRGCRPRVGWATTVGDGCGACRRGGRAGEGRWAGRRGWGCGPGAAQADGGRSWLAAGSAVTCGNRGWAFPGLNLGPHPYQRNAGNRCAKRRFPSSRPTVGAKVMRSIGALVCVHRVLAGRAGQHTSRSDDLSDGGQPAKRPVGFVSVPGRPSLD